MQTGRARSQHDSRRYDGIVFDVGGTLIGFPNQAPFQSFLAQAGLPAADRDARAFHRRFLTVVGAERDKAQGLGAEEADLNAWWHTVFDRTWPDRPDLAEEMYRWLRADRFDRLFDDVVPALEALREMEMPIGVLSNFGSNLEDLLQQLGLGDCFAFVIVSSLVGLAKPDPRIFDLAAAKMGRPPHRLLYVGDHMGDDIEGARSAGLDAVLIDRFGRQPATLCPRISSLRELAAYVQQPTNPAPAIIFDMDGVVLDSPPLHLLTWQRTLEPLGISLTAGDLYPLEGMPTERTAQKLTENLLGRACSFEEAQRLANEKRALFRHMFKPRCVPGIAALLHDLRGRGYHLGLVTGSARSVVDESLVPTGMAGLFEAIVAGDQVSQGKPHPEPYQTAAHLLGYPPAECLAVENAPLGVQSAQAAGMRCVALETTLPAAQLAAADRVFPDARALRDWLLAR